MTTFRFLDALEATSLSLISIRGPPTEPTILRLWLIPLVVLPTACATGRAADRQELAELRSEVRASRERARELDRRLARLEALAAIASPPRPPTRGSSSVPSLAVVKLKPRFESAPKLDTETPVVEPDSEPGADPVDSLMQNLAQRQEVEVPEEDDSILHKQFEESVASLRTGNVEPGVARLKAFAESHPKHPDADNALYFSGLGLMGLGQHEEAAGLLAALVEKFPAGDAVIDATLRLAECRERLKNMTAAKALYTRVVTRYPGTAAASQAEQRLSSMSR